MAAWMDLACSLIESLATHAFRWNEPDYERFRQGLAESLNLLKTQPSPSSVLISAGAVSERIERYHQSTRQKVDSSISELHDIIRVLMSSMDQVHHDCEDSVCALHQIEQTIEQASTADELRIAKAHLTHALGKLAEKAHERKESTSELMTNLQERVLILEKSSGSGTARVTGESLTSTLKQRVAARESERPPVASEEPKNPPARSRNSPESQLDPLTGLPNKEAAEDAIIGLKSNPAGVYLAAFYVQRLEHFNTRFGDKIGNELLFLCAQRIVNALLRTGDQLFRWRGPAFVALLEREDALIDVRREVQHVIGSRFQFDLRGGAMLVSVALAADTFSAGASNCPELIQGLESFFSLPSTRGA